MKITATRLTLALATTTLLVSSCSAASESASVFDLKEGDCINEPEAETEEVKTVPVLPCADEHEYEVFEAYTMDGDDFPGDAAVEATADDVCTEEFEVFIETAYDDSVLDLNFLYPTSTSWGDGDREITCLVFDPDDTTSGSLKGAKR